MKKHLTEFVGTFFLVLTICGAVQSGGGPAVIAIGVMLMALVYMGGPTSGAHYNPAVSFGLALLKKMTWPEAAGYMVSQILGGVIAAFAGSFIFGAVTPIAPGPGVDSVRAIACEALFTLILMLTILNVAASDKAKGNGYFGFAIGAVIVGAAYAGGGVSGGAYNPAVGIGLATAAQGLNHVWIYLVGPVLGAAIATGIFTVMESE